MSICGSAREIQTNWKEIRECSTHRYLYRYKPRLFFGGKKKTCLSLLCTTQREEGAVRKSCAFSETILILHQICCPEDLYFL